MNSGRHEARTDNWGTKERIRKIIFEADTPAGRLFDEFLLVSIILSVVAVMLDSVQEINARYGAFLHGVEWFFTVVFSIEYVLRLATVGRPLLYARSFFGVIDLISVVPTYLSLVVPGGQYLMVIRVLRVLRVFRIFKVVKYVGEANQLMAALKASRRKITVFLFTVFLLVIILGSFMYLIEGPENGFTSIPRSIYWAIVTLTTVGYGDISPKTPPGMALAALVMIMGYGIIAVPTGIVTVEISQQMSARKFSAKACHECSREGHDSDAQFCKFCGASLKPVEE